MSTQSNGGRVTQSNGARREIGSFHSVSARRAHLHEVDCPCRLPVNHIEDSVAMRETEISRQGIAAARRKKRNALSLAVDALQDFKKRAVPANSYHPIKKLRVARQFRRVPGMTCQNSFRRKLMKRCH